MILSIKQPLVKILIIYLINKKYKQIVGERGFICDIKNYTLNMFEGLFIQNVMKANYLINKVNH